MMEGGTYVRSANGDGPSLIARLDDGRIDSFDGIGEAMEVTSKEPMRREVYTEDVKELEEPCGDVFWVR
jgi:hypothetical protein